MKIELKEVTVKEVAEGFEDNDEDGVIGYGGRLNIRPPYQREFVYKDKQRDEVIRTIMRGFPLNVMYWVKNGEESFEVLDGQQRTISFCQYVGADFSVDYRFIHNLTKEEQERILNYKLMIYVCEDGEEREKLDWFRIVNIAGERLTDQELRNSVYSGKWLLEAKKYFSKSDCAAAVTAKRYMKGSPIRQEYLETALKWAADRDGLKEAEDYMSRHQHDENCDDLWNYFRAVFEWVERIFPNYRKEMKGLPWGVYYNAHKEGNFDAAELEKRAASLMEDEDVTNKAGVYLYLLCGDEKHLSVRLFSEKMKREAYERQGGVCAKCGKHFDFSKMQADHITPWSKGGRTIAENCRLLCAECNREKSDA